MGTQRGAWLLAAGLVAVFAMRELDLAILLPAANASAAVRYYEENGATIREARSTVQVPVNDVRFEEQTQSYYRPYTTNQLTQVAVPTPATVTQYRWVPRWHGWWNIFRKHPGGRTWWSW